MVFVSVFVFGRFFYLDCFLLSGYFLFCTRHQTLGINRSFHCRDYRYFTFFFPGSKKKKKESVCTVSSCRIFIRERWTREASLSSLPFRDNTKYDEEREGPSGRRSRPTLRLKRDQEESCPKPKTQRRRESRRKERRERPTPILCRRLREDLHCRHSPMLERKATICKRRL